MTISPPCGIEASAPGKLVVLGEYAVLHGAPALVLAVGQRARVTLRRIEGPDSILESSLWPGRKLRFRPATVRLFEREEAETRQALSLVQHVLAGFRSDFEACLGERGAIDLKLDTRDFYSGSGEASRKLGLGSSAALAVALFGAVHTFVGTRRGSPHARAIWPALWRMYRGQPGQRGSGVDIAASCFGHWVRFQKHPAGDLPLLEPFSPPLRCPLLIVWTGHSTSTGGMLERFFRWEEREPDAFRREVDALTRISEAGSEALRTCDVNRFRLTIDQYAEALQNLGRASGLEIMSEDHRRLRSLALKLNVSYKPSGAGAGDVGLAAAEKPGPLVVFRHQAEAIGYHVMELDQEAQGLEVQPLPEWASV
jgi:phosphomevalonate kinase